MPLMYRRDVEGDQIVLEASPWYYVTRFGTLGLIVIYLVFAAPLGRIGQSAVLVAFAALAVTRIAGSMSLRREISTAMHADGIQITGSTWDPRRPLRYRYRRQLPPASVVKRS